MEHTVCRKRFEYLVWFGSKKSVVDATVWLGVLTLVWKKRFSDRSAQTIDPFPPLPHFPISG
jgi:hypothetical protein